MSASPPVAVGPEPKGKNTSQPTSARQVVDRNIAGRGRADRPVRRSVFDTPRAAEFLELRALQAQTGQPQDQFGHVVVKELIDNALDAAETAGRPPIIDIEARGDGGLTYVTVTDNGVGIAPDAITRICDFTVMVSDKSRYRGPTRGAQGNALKTLLGIPYALGVTKPIVIESNGVRHELAVTIDRVGDVGVTHDQTASDRTEGTSVTVPLPDDLDVDIGQWAFVAALVNPHTQIAANNQAHTDETGDSVLYRPAGGSWHKWTPSSPSSPHWYDAAAFGALVHSHIREIARTGVDKPLGQFIAEFEGLSGSQKQKAIRTAAGGVTHLSGLEGRDDVIAALRDAMLDHAKPTPASRLGVVGHEHYKRLLNDTYGVERSWFKTLTATVDGIPWIVEVTVADTTEPGKISYATNHSPTFGDPLGRTQLDSGDICYAFGAAPFLAASGVDPDDDNGQNCAAVVHIVCAATQFVDKGKVALVVPPTVARIAADALAGATKTLRREADQRRKDARKGERAQERARRDQRAKQTTIKDAVFEVMQEAKRRAGSIVDARTLFYKVRPLIQPLTKKELNYSYFSQELLPEYERTVAPLHGLYYEARGKLHHPHDGLVVPLGTREVEAYMVPPWQFDKVIYVEKEGLEAQLAPYQLGRKYDAAFIFGKGYSPVATRNLLASSSIRDMKLFVVHDADPDGYNIARTIREATRRMPNHSVDVVDLGLHVPQAIAEELETETFTRKKALPTVLELDYDALEWFTGTPISAGYGKRHYECTRCELNAFSADELAEFIEAGLQRHGATTKLMPPTDVLDGHVHAVRDEALGDLVMAELERMGLDVGAVVRRLIVDNPDLATVDETRVRDGFTNAPTWSWRSLSQQFARDDVDAADGLAEAAHALIIDQLGHH